MSRLILLWSAPFFWFSWMRTHGDGNLCDPLGPRANKVGDLLGEKRIDDLQSQQNKKKQLSWPSKCKQQEEKVELTPPRWTTAALREETSLWSSTSK